MKVLLSAYACEPGRGSEPGVGWNTAMALAERHDVWVLTRANNRPAIERELKGGLARRLHFDYIDLPRWASWWKRGKRGLMPYYYLWQVAAGRRARQLHKKQAFDVAHHVTFVRYWSPSFLSLLPIPFVWGPVGGAEVTPPSLWPALSQKARMYELLRAFVRRIGDADPFVRTTARRSALAMATTYETAEALTRLRAARVEVLSEVALARSDYDMLAAIAGPHRAAPERIRFISIGRLLNWKGFELGLRAFALANLDNASYVIVGDGPERRRLEKVATQLGIADRVRMTGGLPRDAALAELASSDVLMHPSMHDSGGWVCVEAMAAGRPVICLDIGGPRLQVTDECGFRVPVAAVSETVGRLARCMERLASDSQLLVGMGTAGRVRAQHFLAETKLRRLSDAYDSLASC